jgi:hypothetical protein
MRGSSGSRELRREKLPKALSHGAWKQRISGQRSAREVQRWRCRGANQWTMDDFAAWRALWAVRDKRLSCVEKGGFWRDFAHAKGFLGLAKG